MPIPAVCKRCDGVGRLVWRSQVITCPECDGKGWARSTQILMEPKKADINDNEWELAE